MLVRADVGCSSSHDIEAFIVSGRLKVSRDRIEFRIGCPRRATRERFTTLSELTFTEVVRSVDVVQFVLNVGAFKELPKPLSLIPSVTREIKHNRNAAQQ